MHIEKIEQINKTTFSIVWSDRRVDFFHLKDLQRLCPCQRCCGKRETGHNEDTQEVKVLKIMSVGNYALRIFFASGCSEGIYSFEFLRSMRKSL